RMQRTDGYGHGGGSLRLGGQRCPGAAGLAKRVDATGSRARLTAQTRQGTRNMAAATIDVPAGGFRYIPGVFQYSAGVAALDGFRIERVEFRRPIPLAAGFAFIERHLR